MPCGLVLRGKPSRIVVVASNLSATRWAPPLSDDDRLATQIASICDATRWTLLLRLLRVGSFLYAVVRLTGISADERIGRTYPLRDLITLD